MKFTVYSPRRNGNQCEIASQIVGELSYQTIVS